MRHLQMIGIVMIFLVFTAETCQKDDTVTTCYQSLVSAAVTYDVAMGSTADLHAAGQISDAQKDAVIVIGRKFWTAFHSLRDALERYVDGKGSKAEITAKQTDLADALAELLATTGGVK